MKTTTNISAHLLGFFGGCSLGHISCGILGAAAMGALAEKITGKIKDVDKSYISKKSFEEAFDCIRQYMGIEGYMANDRLHRIALPLSLRGLTIDNLAIRRQDDVKV